MRISNRIYLNISLHLPHFQTKQISDASGKVPMSDISWRISSSTLSPGAYELDGSSVKVLHAGNYFIYAQVTFFTLVNYDSFQITINGNPFVSCKSSQQVCVSLFQFFVCFDTNVFISPNTQLYKRLCQPVSLSVCLLVQWFMSTRQKVGKQGI